jgi:putative membrane-bound dehydrogenase-like protein
MRYPAPSLRHPGLALALLKGLAAVTLAQEPAGPTLDFDHDGNPERLVNRPGVSTVETRDAASGAWKPAGYPLPDGVFALDAAGRDAGLRWVDLNGDGFDDVLWSNADAFAIHLWNKNVQPQLGWTRGWSHEVRTGRRTGAPGEPPSLVGASVRLEAGQVVITQPPRDGQPERAVRVAAATLIDIGMPPPKSPTEALAAFRVRSGFHVELVAAEPVVIDPVAFDWGADGRLWVVEMRDYPLGVDGKGKPGGVVKVLQDADRDGHYEAARVFLADLPFPSSVMAWGRGALIAAAPDVFYAEDTDGDGRADVRRVLLTGFEPGNQQHRVNGFEWGLDGWVYVANGDSGGKVRSVATGQTVSISGRDLRFRPETGELEAVSVQTQFGRRRDDWGNWFGNNNPTWLWHVTIPEHYLRRNSQVAVKSVRHVLANYPDSTRVFPVSPPLVRPNQPWSLNHVTSGCSATPYRDDLFGPEFATTVFASEPVHNAVHREVLERDGSGFSSHRAPGEERSEFLASTDNWFRPTTLRTGPDGALYVADMYRFSLEHPEWISAEQQARIPLRAGEDRGRIYRVVPDGRPRRAIPDLSRLDVPGLVAAMDSPNGWQRDWAQRLLAARPDVAKAAVGPLRELLAVTHAPQVRIQALATLGLLGVLEAATLQQALGDPHPAVRAEALRQAERHAPTAGPVWTAVAALASDAEASVRLQAAFSLGAWPPELAEPVLSELAARPDNDETTRIAILTSLRPERPLFGRLKANQRVEPAATVARLTPSSADRAAVIARYGSVAQLTGDAARGRTVFGASCAPCHRLRGEGHEVGPDLGMVAGKPLDWLLTAILDPNQAVETRYRAWAATLGSGESVAGLLAAETANNLVLRVPGGAEQAVLRRDVVKLEPVAGSLMPVGFESTLSTQAMADLLAWVRAEGK